MEQKFCLEQESVVNYEFLPGQKFQLKQHNFELKSKLIQSNNSSHSKNLILINNFDWNKICNEMCVFRDNQYSIR